MLRVLAEDDTSLPPLVPDGIYGQETIGAVTAFQRNNQLPATGIADQQTWEAIAKAYDTALIRVGKAEPIEIIMDPGQVFILGEESPYILLAQSMLIFLSGDFDSIPTPNHTGILDRETARSLSGFQVLNGLPETGQLDKITWKNLSKQFTLHAHHKAAPHIDRG
jgi:peptidoglycan hydrolase-like protein with peptidoglycan-binding domain